MEMKTPKSETPVKMNPEHILHVSVNHITWNSGSWIILWTEHILRIAWNCDYLSDHTLDGCEILHELMGGLPHYL